MDSSANHHTTFRCGFQGANHQRTHWREDQRSIEFIGRHLVGATCPDRPQLAGESLRSFVSRAGEGVNTLPLIDGDLGDDMSRTWAMM